VAYRVCAGKKNLDAQLLLVYFWSAMNTLNNIPVTPREPSDVPTGSRCAHTAHRHTHHAGTATRRTFCSAVD